MPTESVNIPGLIFRDQKKNFQIPNGFLTNAEGTNENEVSGRSLPPVNVTADGISLKKKNVCEVAKLN